MCLNLTWICVSHTTALIRWCYVKIALETGIRYNFYKNYPLELCLMNRFSIDRISNAAVKKLNYLISITVRDELNISQTPPPTPNEFQLHQNEEIHDLIRGKSVSITFLPFPVRPIYVNNILMSLLI